MITWPTGSKVHRTWKCPASAVLPHDVDETREEKIEPFRGRGKVIHWYLENVRTLGVDVALSKVDIEHRELCRMLDVERMPTHLATEVAYAYDWKTKTARELGRNLGHRNYHLLSEPPTKDEICTTLDVVGEARFPVQGVEVHRGYVGDYKTGHTKYPRPGAFGQTLLGALCVQSVHGVDDCTLELIYIDPDDGEHYTARDTVDSWAMDAFADELAEVMGNLEQYELDHVIGLPMRYREGSHCDYCPAFKHCDAKVRSLKAIPAELVQLGLMQPPPKSKNGDDDAAVVGFAPGVINIRNAAAIYEACERIEALCRVARREVCGIAWTEPIELSDGRVIERYKHERRVVDGPTAAAVLEQRYGREQAMRAIDIKVSLSSIREVVVANIDHTAKPRQKIETAKGDGQLDLVLAEIDRRGGLATNVGEECKPRMPRKKKLVAGNGG